MAKIVLEVTVDGATNEELDGISYKVEMALRRGLVPPLKAEVSDEIERDEDDKD